MPKFEPISRPCLLGQGRNRDADPLPGARTGRGRHQGQRRLARPIADTEGLSRLATDAELAERIRGALALPRFGQRIDIGNAVAWLCSEAARLVAGTTIDCDGGMRLGNLYAPE
jgi:NAD(P)-dependent dehydrogenase (short-subunit alcohol dehydrogenase family)